MEKLVFLTSTIVFIPITRALLNAVDCTLDETGTWRWDVDELKDLEDRIICYQGMHLHYSILTALSFSLFIPISIRLATVGGDIRELQGDLC